MITKLFPREEGQGLVEYALILVLIAVVVIAILLLLGPAVSQVYCKVANALQPGSCGVITNHKIKVTGKALHVQDITVSTNAAVTVTITDQSSGDDDTTSQACTPSSCSNITFGGTNSGSGVITTDQGDYITFIY